MKTIETVKYDCGYEEIFGLRPPHRLEHEECVVERDGKRYLRTTCFFKLKYWDKEIVKVDTQSGDILTD